MTGTLILVCGLPGAGKTTLAKRLERERGAVRMCPDERLSSLGIDLWDAAARDRIEDEMWDEARALLVEGRDVILEYGFWPREHRDPKRAGARELGACVELYVLDPPLETLVERVESRDALEEPRITRTDIEGWWDTFERPTAEERALYDRVVVTE